MFAPLRNGGPRRPGYRRIAGVTLMLTGVALMGSGAHYLTENGTCSAGHVSFGPAHACGGGASLYLMSVFLLAPALAVAGWWLARLGGALWPAVSAAVGAGLVTVRAGHGTAASAREFGLIAGACLLTLTLVSVVPAVRRRLRARRPPANVPVRQVPAGPGTTLIVNTRAR